LASAPAAYLADGSLELVARLQFLFLKYTLVTTGAGRCRIYRLWGRNHSNSISKGGWQSTYAL